MSIVRQRRPKIRLCRLPVMGLILLLSGCNLNPLLSSPPPGVPAVAMPPSLRAEDIVGRWGLAAYHRDQDRARTIVAARDQCTQAFLIDRSPRGDILMLGHDNPPFGREHLFVPACALPWQVVSRSRTAGTLAIRMLQSTTNASNSTSLPVPGAVGALSGHVAFEIAPLRPATAPRRHGPILLLWSLASFGGISPPLAACFCPPLRQHDIARAGEHGIG
jgi:hypothetical protein